MESIEQLEPTELNIKIPQAENPTENISIEIQANTFKNWVNQQLKYTSDDNGELIVDLAKDFRDGTRLCALVEILSGQKLPKWNPKPENQHDYLENVSTALRIIETDGVELIDIGNVDVVDGNLKVILDLIWSLIVKYQIGTCKFLAKELMLTWLNAVFPQFNINNFTTDWNSGSLLGALLYYCQQGCSAPRWGICNFTGSVSNCRTAMEDANCDFDIPIILDPEHLGSPYVDEFSVMTYISYFMKEGSPGSYVTLREVNCQLIHSSIKNFTTDWNDGRVLCSLVKNLGGPAPSYYEMKTDRTQWESNIQQGIDGAEKLGVESILQAKDMADPNVEHLGVMAYAARFRLVEPQPQADEQIADFKDEKISVHMENDLARARRPVVFKIEISSKEVDSSKVRGEVIRSHEYEYRWGKKSEKPLKCKVTWNETQGECTFVPTEMGMHKLIIYNDEDIIVGCPYYFRVLPPKKNIDMYPKDYGFAMGSIVEIPVNSYETGNDAIKVIACSPTGKSLSCFVEEIENILTASFQPDEIGEWTVTINHKNGTKKKCISVIDPKKIFIDDTEGAIAGQPFFFTVDRRAIHEKYGPGSVDIVYNKKSVRFGRKDFNKEPVTARYRIKLWSCYAGTYLVYIYANGSDIPGSPFPIHVKGFEH